MNVNVKQKIVYAQIGIDMKRKEYWRKKNDFK